MKTEEISSYWAGRKGSQPSRLAELAATPQSTPPPEVRRSILRRLTLRLAEEGLFETSRDQEGSYKQEFSGPQIIIKTCN